MDPVATPIRHSITFRMTVAVCVFVVLFQSLLAVLALVYFKRELQQAITDQQFTMLTVISQNIDQKLRSSQRILVDVSGHVTPEIIRDSDAAQRFLDIRPGTKSTFDNGLFLFSRQGRIIAESPFRPDRRGRDISFRDYYKKTMATGQPVISEPYVSTHTPGVPAVIFTAPLKDRDGRITAILAGSLNLLHNNFLGELAGTRIASSGYLYLLTRGRTMIMHPDKSWIMQPVAPPGANPLLDRALQGFEGSGESVNSRGGRALTSFKHLHAADWIIAANYPLDEAYAPIQRARSYLALALIIGTAVIIIVVRRIMERNTSTLVAFASHVNAIAAKQGEERLFRHDSDDEIGVLVRTFNVMIQDEDRKSRELFHTSTHDALTGLFNRRYLMEALEKELQRCIRKNGCMSLIILDIDHFKGVNDTHGHLQGDVVLQKVALSMQKELRSYDIAARYGGEEFVAVLPDSTHKEAMFVADRVRLSIQGIKFSGALAPLSITVSLGVATFPSPNCATVDEFIKLADDALYLAKANGRNRVEFIE